MYGPHMFNRDHFRKLSCEPSFNTSTKEYAYMCQVELNKYYHASNPNPVKFASKDEAMKANQQLMEDLNK